MNAWSVERADVGDAPEIARLLSRVVPERFLDLTIWGSPLFYRYCEDSIRSDAPVAPRFYVLRSKGSVGGAVSLRQIENQIVLDTAYVLPELRANYLGMKLLYEASRCEYQHDPTCWVAWDVFSGRPRLEAWHRSLGGSVEYLKGWWLRGPDALDVASESPASIQGLTEADVQHARWGFSSFEIQTAIGTYRVGRLPGRTFRLTAAHAAHDWELFAALRKVDAHSRILLMGPVEPPATSWTEVTTLKRYRAQFATFAAALKQYL